MAVRTSARPMSTPLQRASTNIKRGAGASGPVRVGSRPWSFSVRPWSWSWSWSWSWWSLWSWPWSWSWSWYVCRRLAVSEGCGNGSDMAAMVGLSGWRRNGTCRVAGKKLARAQTFPARQRRWRRARNLASVNLSIRGRFSRRGTHVEQRGFGAAGLLAACRAHAGPRAHG